MLKNFVRQKLSEMAMQFDNPNEVQPHPDNQHKLATNQTPLNKIPMPKPAENSGYSNHMELMASERYREVLNRVKHFTGMQTVTDNDTMSLVQTMIGAFHKVQSMEKAYRPQLANLAVKVIMQEMGIKEGDLQFDAEIFDGMYGASAAFNTTDSSDDVDVEDIVTDDEKNMDLEAKLYEKLKNLDLERAKRRLVNALIQGASKKYHYSYLQHTDNIKNLVGQKGDELISCYGLMMSINDLMYWLWSDNFMMQQTIKAADGEETNAAGLEKINWDTDPPTVIARGFCFPVLLHELAKGVMEVLGAHGIPQNKQVAEKVIELEDVLQKETWDLRVGPAIWAALRETMLSDELLNDENQKEIQNFLFAEIVKLPPKNILKFFYEVFKQSDKAKLLCKDLAKDIKLRLKNQNDEDYDYAEPKFEQDLNEMTQKDNDDVDKMLRDLGIFDEDNDDED